jgi:hypothetical protein
MQKPNYVVSACCVRSCNLLCACWLVDVPVEDGLEMMFQDAELARLAFKPRPRGSNMFLLAANIESVCDLRSCSEVTIID